jgi:hypothetical protein
MNRQRWKCLGTGLAKCHSATTTLHTEYESLGETQLSGRKTCQPCAPSGSALPLYRVARPMISHVIQATSQDPALGAATCPASSKHRPSLAHSHRLPAKFGRMVSYSWQRQTDVGGTANTCRCGLARFTARIANGPSCICVGFRRWTSARSLLGCKHALPIPGKPTIETAAGDLSFEPARSYLHVSQRLVGS